MSSVIQNTPPLSPPRRLRAPIVALVPEFVPPQHRTVPRAATTTAHVTDPTLGRRDDPCRTAPPPPTEVQLVLRLIVEVVAGRRAGDHLAGRVTRRVQRYVLAEAHRPGGQSSNRHRMAGGRGSIATARGSLRGMRMCRPADGVAEVSAVWLDRGRYRALASRFECHPAPGSAPRWVCTVLRLG